MHADMLSEDTTTKAWNGTGTSPVTSLRSNTEPTGLPWLRNINIPDHTATGTCISHHSLCVYLKCPRVYVQIIIIHITWGSPWHGCLMSGLDFRHYWGIPIISTHQGNQEQEHQRRIALKGLPNLRSVPHQYFQLHYTTTDSGVITHQNYNHKYYILGIVTSGIINTTKGTANATNKKHSGNW